ncbi:MAG: hypothetical protein NPINA01_33520 [Nitrospinaceae bacterium]|nr:MAG: hypothetical protein NPINA01_33520 [Nitrospinaceae bacterium]
MSTVIDTCAGLSDVDCGVYVKTTCTGNPNSCGIYYDFFNDADVTQFSYVIIIAMLSAWLFKAVKKMIVPSI